MQFKKYLKENYDLDIIYDEEIDRLIEQAFNIELSINELSATADMFPQEWGEITADDEPTKIEQAKQIYQKAKDMALSVKNKFVSMLRRVAQFKNSKVLVDIKGIESFIDKAVYRYPQKGLGAQNITDVLRSAVLVNDKEEVEQTVRNIKKLFAVAKHKEKKAGVDPEYGYFGSHHFYVQVDKMLAEIQVMTKKLWSYKEQAHKIYNKYRSIEIADKNIQQMDKKLSKRLFQLANVDREMKKRKKGKPEFTKHERKYKKFY